MKPWVIPFPCDCPRPDLCIHGGVIFRGSLVGESGASFEHMGSGAGADAPPRGFWENGMVQGLLSRGVGAMDQLTALCNSSTP